MDNVFELVGPNPATGMAVHALLKVSRDRVSPISFMRLCVNNSQCDGISEHLSILHPKKGQIRKTGKEAGSIAGGG